MRLFKTLMAVAVGAVFAASAAMAETPKNTLVIADAIDDVITLDPGEVSEVAGVLVSQQLYQPLVTFDINDPTKIIPVLAKSWDVSEDGKTFTFKMNRDAKFSSGNPVTAYDAEFSLQRPILLDTRISFILKQFGFTKENVKEQIKATDDDTLVFTVNETYAPSFVLYVLSSYTAGIAAFIPEVDGLIAMGYTACSCFPIVIAGETRGVVALLGDAGIFTTSALAEIDALLPIAALTFTFHGISARR